MFDIRARLKIQQSKSAVGDQPVTHLIPSWLIPESATERGFNACEYRRFTCDEVRLTARQPTRPPSQSRYTSFPFLSSSSRLLFLVKSSNPQSAKNSIWRHCCSDHCSSCRLTCVVWEGTCALVRTCRVRTHRMREGCSDHGLWKSETMKQLRWNSYGGASLQLPWCGAGGRALWEPLSCNATLHRPHTEKKSNTFLHPTFGAIRRYVLGFRFFMKLARKREYCLSGILYKGIRVLPNLSRVAKHIQSWCTHYLEFLFLLLIFRLSFLLLPYDIFLRSDPPLLHTTTTHTHTHTHTHHLNADNNNNNNNNILFTPVTFLQ